MKYLVFAFLLVGCCYSNEDMSEGQKYLPCVVLEKEAIRETGFMRCACQDTILKDFMVEDRIYIKYQVGDTIKSY